MSVFAFEKAAYAEVVWSDTKYCLIQLYIFVVYLVLPLLQCDLFFIFYERPNLNGGLAPCLMFCAIPTIPFHLISLTMKNIYLLNKRNYVIFFTFCSCSLFFIVVQNYMDAFVLYEIDLIYFSYTTTHNIYRIYCIAHPLHMLQYIFPTA